MYSPLVIILAGLDFSIYQSLCCQKSADNEEQLYTISAKIRHNTHTTRQVYTLSKMNAKDAKTRNYPKNLNGYIPTSAIAHYLSPSSTPSC